MRCQGCGHAWPPGQHVTDFGNGLVIECGPGVIEVRFVEFDEHGRSTVARTCDTSRAELQNMLDRAYGVER